LDRRRQFLPATAGRRPCRRAQASAGKKGWAEAIDERSSRCRCRTVERGERLRLPCCIAFHHDGEARAFRKQLRSRQPARLIVAPAGRPHDCAHRQRTLFERRFGQRGGGAEGQHLGHVLLVAGSRSAGAACNFAQLYRSSDFESAAACLSGARDRSVTRMAAGRVVSPLRRTGSSPRSSKNGSIWDR
jgi:hypothetical protein